MKLKPCTCGTEHFERIRRSWWMRLMTSRRHYRCSRCEATMFIPMIQPPRRIEPVFESSASPRKRA